MVLGVPEIATGAQLLVRILAAPQDIAAWPWELLLDPQQPERFLTMARDVHVVRSGRSRTYPVRQATIEPPLNLLMVMSSPILADSTEAEAPFDLYAEKRSLLAELLPLVDRGLLNVEVEDRPRWSTSGSASEPNGEASTVPLPGACAAGRPQAGAAQRSRHDRSEPGVRPAPAAATGPAPGGVRRLRDGAGT